MLRSEIDEARRKEALEKEFRQLADQWREETGMHSAPRKILGHPAYQLVIAMGEKAIPIILKELNARGGEWYFALREITGENPVPEHARGRTQLMKAAWIEWGKKHKYI